MSSTFKCILMIRAAVYNPKAFYIAYFLQCHLNNLSFGNIRHKIRGYLKCQKLQLQSLKMTKIHLRHMLLDIISGVSDLSMSTVSRLPLSRTTYIHVYNTF